MHAQPHRGAFGGDRGVPQLFYGGLAAIDADGMRLNATLATVDGSIVIRDDDGAARYPVVIDPIVVTELAFLTASDAGAVYVFTRAAAVWTQETKLIASDAAPLDLFGRSLQLEGASLSSARRRTK